jgi:hypothetical protein
MHVVLLTHGSRGDVQSYLAHAIDTAAARDAALRARAAALGEKIRGEHGVGAASQRFEAQAADARVAIQPENRR